MEIGSLVLCNSFRNPAILAKMATALDEVSDGRLILGVGAGWNEPEYQAFGLPFDHRASRFEEAIQILIPMLRDGHVDFTGQYYQARNCEDVPRGPRQQGPPLMFGAEGPRMIKLAARHADLWNTGYMGQPETMAGPLATIEAACREVGRDPATMGVTALIGLWFSDLQREKPAFVDDKHLEGTPEELAAAISACEGVFRCDCRGVGTDWQVAEVRKISTALLGTVDIVPDPAGLAADFTAMMANAMGKQVADVALRVWTPQRAAVRFVKQVAPAVDDLTGRRTPSGPQAGDYPTGAWGPGESRDYHVGIEVSPAGLGQEMLAARISLMAGPQVLGQGLVRAIWTDDEALSTKINSRVAHYTGQAELAEAIQDGLEARKQGDEETATAKLGRAVALAHQSGNEDTAKLLAKVVDVVDVETGTVRLKKKVDDVDEMALDTRSTKTVRVKKDHA